MTCISLNLRHVHDLVLLSIKVEVIHFILQFQLVSCCYVNDRWSGLPVCSTGRCIQPFLTTLAAYIKYIKWNYMKQNHLFGSLQSYYSAENPGDHNPPKRCGILNSHIMYLTFWLSTFVHGGKHLLYHEHPVPGIRHSCVHIKIMFYKNESQLPDTRYFLTRNFVLATNERIPLPAIMPRLLTFCAYPSITWPQTQITGHRSFSIVHDTHLCPKTNSCTEW